MPAPSNPAALPALLEKLDRLLQKPDELQNDPNYGRIWRAAIETEKRRRTEWEAERQRQRARCGDAFNGRELSELAKCEFEQADRMWDGCIAARRAVLEKRVEVLRLFDDTQSASACKERIESELRYLESAATQVHSTVSYAETFSRAFTSYSLLEKSIASMIREAMLRVGPEYLGIEYEKGGISELRLLREQYVGKFGGKLRAEIEWRIEGLRLDLHRVDSAMTLERGVEIREIARKLAEDALTQLRDRAIKTERGALIPKEAHGTAGRVINDVLIHCWRSQSLLDGAQREGYAMLCGAVCNGQSDYETKQAAILLAVDSRGLPADLQPLRVPVADLAFDESRLPVAFKALGLVAGELGGKSGTYAKPIDAERAALGIGGSAGPESPAANTATGQKPKRRAGRNDGRRLKADAKVAAIVNALRTEFGDRLWFGPQYKLVEWVEKNVPGVSISAAFVTRHKKRLLEPPAPSSHSNPYKSARPVRGEREAVSHDPETGDDGPQEFYTMPDDAD